MKIEITADDHTAPYGDDELLAEGQATTEAGVPRIANRVRARHRTGVRVYLDGKLQVTCCDGRGPSARVVALICDA
ncbi:MAG: hypothetical protein A2Y61_00335 [Chloroflexi bacterium RBG_13_60_13]|nr:MAG: hypothetical protein A2Y61_00335 [Chloroflexi bacterium RBG_13_60_13]